MEQQPVTQNNLFQDQSVVQMQVNVPPFSGDKDKRDLASQLQIEESQLARHREQIMEMIANTNDSYVQQATRDETKSNVGFNEESPSRFDVTVPGDSKMESRLTTKKRRSKAPTKK
jgi:hypothetical protein